MAVSPFPLFYNSEAAYLGLHVKSATALGESQQRCERVQWSEIGHKYVENTKFAANMSKMQNRPQTHWKCKKKATNLSKIQNRQHIQLNFKTGHKYVWNLKLPKNASKLLKKKTRIMISSNPIHYLSWNTNLEPQHFHSLSFNQLAQRIYEMLPVLLGMKIEFDLLLINLKFTCSMFLFKILKSI